MVEGFGVERRRQEEDNQRTPWVSRYRGKWYSERTFSLKSDAGGTSASTYGHSRHVAEQGDGGVT